MKKLKSILLFVILLGSISCATYHPQTNLSGSHVEGIILDGETGNVMIGQGVFEYERQSNNTITDTSGQFKITFIGNSSIVGLTGCFEQILVQLDPNKYNEIKLGPKTYKQSRKLTRSLTNYNKKLQKQWSDYSLLGRWEVINVDYHFNRQYDYLDKIDPNQRIKKLKQLFPKGLNESDKLQFNEEGIVDVNRWRKYGFNKRGDLLNVTLSDMIYSFKIEIDGEDQLRFRKETAVGVTEWTIKRK